MSASGAGGSRVRELFNRAANAGSLGEVIFQGIGAVLLAIGTALASGVLTIADVLIVPLQALTAAAAALVDAIFGGAAFIIEAAAAATGLSIAPGGTFDVGPFTFALGIGAVLLALYLVNRYVSLETTGNIIPGISVDVPTPGLTDAEEESSND